MGLAMGFRAGFLGEEASELGGLGGGGLGRA